jgi:hypothetical protein
MCPRRQKDNFFSVADRQWLNNDGGAGVASCREGKIVTSPLEITPFIMFPYLQMGEVRGTSFTGLLK